MVDIEDRDSRFGASIEVVWRYHPESGADHARAHLSTPNVEIRPVSDRTFGMASKALIDGRWDKDGTRFAAPPTLGIVAELPQAPLTGSKMSRFRIPRGGQTQIDILGECESPTTVPGRLAEVAPAALDLSVEEDSPIPRRRAQRTEKDLARSPMDDRQ